MTSKLASVIALCLCTGLSHGETLSGGIDPFKGVKDDWEGSSRLTIEHWMAITRSTVRFYVQWHKQAKIVFDHELGIIHATATGESDREAKDNLDNAINDSLNEIDTWDTVADDKGQITADVKEAVRTAPTIVTEFEGVKVASKRFYMVADHIRVRGEKYIPLITKYSDLHELRPELVAAVIEAESYYNPKAVSSANAVGLMQLVPQSGGRDAMRLTGRQDRNPHQSELYDPEFNISLGTAYLAHLKGYYDYVHNERAKEYLALAAYNWGANNVDRQIRPEPETTHQEVIYRLTAAPKETRDYISRIRHKEKQYGWL